MPSGPKKRKAARKKKMMETHAGNDAKNLEEAQEEPSEEGANGTTEDVDSAVQNGRSETEKGCSNGADEVEGDIIRIDSAELAYILSAEEPDHDPPPEKKGNAEEPPLSTDHSVPEESEPISLMTTAARQKTTFWNGCCGLFQLFKGSE